MQAQRPRELGAGLLFDSHGLLNGSGPSKRVEHKYQAAASESIPDDICTYAVTRLGNYLNRPSTNL